MMVCILFTMDHYALCNECTITMVIFLKFTLAAPRGRADPYTPNLIFKLKGGAKGEGHKVTKSQYRGPILWRV